MKNKEEYILCAAIWYKFIPIKKELPMEVMVRPINCDQGLVFCGHRHAQCMYTMVSITGIRSVESEVGAYTQGFLTNKNRFVDRKEAMVIAKEANQVKEDTYSDRLFSEDLY